MRARIRAFAALLHLRLWRAVNPARVSWMPRRLWFRLAPDLALFAERYNTPGRSEVWWVTTLSSLTAPSAAQLNAGVDITPDSRQMPNIPRSGNTVDVANLSETFEARQTGTRGGDTATHTIFRDTVTEAAFDALTEDAAGFLVLGRKGLAAKGTWASGDEADVFPAKVLTVEDGGPGRNDADTATIAFVITATPERKATVAV